MIRMNISHIKSNKGIDGLTIFLTLRQFIHQKGKKIKTV